MRLEEIGARIGRRIRPLLPETLRRAAERVWGHVAAAGVRRHLRGLEGGTEPILVGPWLGEVGFEVLYWIPFLRWAVSEHGLDPERLVAISRGGVEGWYDGVAGRYVELFELLTPQDLAALKRRRAIWDRGQKQVRLGAIEEELIREIVRHLGVDRHDLLHPSLMANLLRPYWWEAVPVSWVDRFTRAGLLHAPGPANLESLPSEYVAARFYTNDAMPGSARVRDRLREICDWLADRVPVVWLRANLGLDEHDDLIPDDPRIRVVDVSTRPERNLALQSTIIAGARLLIGTYGGYSYLGPSLGTSTLAAYEKREFFPTHLRLAEARFAAAPFGRFQTHMLAGLDRATLERALQSPART